MSFLLLNWKMMVIGILSVMVTLFYNLWRSEHDALVSFKSAIAATAAAAEAENARMLRVQLLNLDVLKVDYEAKIPEVIAGAVAAYKRDHPPIVSVVTARSGGVSPNGSGIKLDDAAIGKCVPDSTFIETSAVDAIKIAEWIMYCKLNHCPVKD